MVVESSRDFMPRNRDRGCSLTKPLASVVKRWSGREERISSWPLSTCHEEGATERGRSEIPLMRVGATHSEIGEATNGRREEQVASWQFSTYWDIQWTRRSENCCRFSTSEMGGATTRGTEE